VTKISGAQKCSIPEIGIAGEFRGIEVGCADEFRRSEVGGTVEFAMAEIGRAIECRVQKMAFAIKGSKAEIYCALKIGKIEMNRLFHPQPADIQIAGNCAIVKFGRLARSYRGQNIAGRNNSVFKHTGRQSD